MYIDPKKLNVNPLACRPFHSHYSSTVSWNFETTQMSKYLDYCSNCQLTYRGLLFCGKYYL